MSKFLHFVFAYRKFHPESSEVSHLNLNHGHPESAPARGLRKVSGKRHSSTCKSSPVQHGRFETERENMKHMNYHLIAFIREEHGATATEYAVMLALIVVVCIAAITALGEKVSTSYVDIESALP